MLQPHEYREEKTDYGGYNRYDIIPTSDSDRDEKDGLKRISNNIKKSQVDDREYRYIRLRNSINCILVHDEDTEKSAACLAVGAGNLLDPHPVSG